MHLETVVVLLFALAAGVALLARWLKLPYTVALVIAGLLLGGTHRFPAPHLSKELVFTVFLPGLLFEAAFHLEFRRFWQNKLAINALAVPGVIVAIGLTALMLTPVVNALHFVDGFGIGHGLVFAALIAATDPIAVVGLFKSVGAPKRLAVLVEGESLLNDGTSVVFFGLVVDLVSGRDLSVASALIDFLKIVGLGAAVGTAVSYGIAKIIQRVDDAMVEITLTTVAAYGSFVLAEQLHASGVIATVIAGMVCGNYAAHTGMTATTRLAVESFWEYVAFALNSFIFLLIGLEVHVDDLVASLKPILVAYAVVTLGRAAVVWIVAGALHRTRERIPPLWNWVLTWGGLRGGISMVLALGLPKDFAHRNLLITMTFGVVVLSIIVQGFTTGPLLHRLGLTSVTRDHDALEVERARAIRARAALDVLATSDDIPQELLTKIRDDYEQVHADASATVARLSAGVRGTDAEHERIARRRLLHVERDALRAALRDGEIGSPAFDHQSRLVDQALVELEAETEEAEREASAPVPPPPEAQATAADADGARERTGERGAASDEGPTDEGARDDDA